MTLDQIRKCARKAYDKTTPEGKKVLDRALTKSMGYVKDEAIERQLMEAIIKAVS